MAIKFVDGEKGGNDYAIYQSIYKSYNVVSRSGCQTVIESVRALRLMGLKQNQAQIKPKLA